MVKSYSKASDGETGLPEVVQVIGAYDGTLVQAVKCNSDGELVMNIDSITPGSGATDLGKAEDAAHASGDVGIQCLTVRKNTAAATSGTDGDYQPLITNTSGALWVDLLGAIPAGTNAIGKLAANSGVDIGDVDITSIAAGDNNIGNVDVVTLPALVAGSAMIGNVNMGATITSGSVAMVATTSTLIIAAAATRKRLIVRNRSNTAAEVVRVGPTAATTAMFTLMPTKIGTTDVMNEPLVLEGFTGALYGYSESGTPTIEYIEILT